MSVIAYEYSEFEGVYNQMVKVPELQKIVMNNDYVKRYNSRQMPVSMKYKYEDALGRLFWYMYVANRVAYSLQYQRNEDIFTPEVTAEKYTLDEAKQKFGSFMYNIYTNNGTVFLSEDWLGLAEDIKKFIYPKDFAKGGEVKFDEDYYGYSAKVPYLNETYLVEFGKNPNPPYDSVNISDRSFRIVDKNSSTAKNIYNKMLKEKAKQKPFNNAFADGGTLPTPFGQAGLVGETGAMNETDLFAMGGDLPQGVHQYYANTYNPAYPTPHGYAKGGKTQGYNDKLDESLGNTKGKRSTKEQNYKDRRNESEAMEKKEGKRKYSRVKTMDKNRRKRKTPMTLAKEIRKEGEKWVDAVKRASKMMKNK